MKNAAAEGRNKAGPDQRPVLRSRSSASLPNTPGGSPAAAPECEHIHWISRAVGWWCRACNKRMDNQSSDAFGHNWTSCDFPPKEVGVYERQIYGNSGYFQYWHGEFWNVPADSFDRALDESLIVYREPKLVHGHWRKPQRPEAQAVGGQLLSETHSQECPAGERVPALRATINGRRLRRNSLRELLPCPFCGSKDVVLAKGYMCVECNGCDAEMPGMKGDDNPDAMIARWNKRHAHLAQPEAAPVATRVCPIKDIQCSTPDYCERRMGRCKLLNQPEAAEPGPLYVIFDGPPDHESGRFVEVETAAGKSIGEPLEWERCPFPSQEYWRLGPFYVAPVAAQPAPGAEGE